MDGQQRAGYGADVDEHVAGVGQQHEGVGGDCSGDLERHEGHEEAEGHDERAAVGLGGDAAGTDVSVPFSHAAHVVGVVHHLRHQKTHVLVVDHVEDAVPFAPAANESGQAELGQVLGDGGGLRTHQLGQLVDGTLPLHQGPDHPQPGLVGEELQHADGGPDVVSGRNLPYLRRHADRLPYPRRSRGPRTPGSGPPGPEPVQACGGGAVAVVKSVTGGAGTLQGWLTEPCGRAASSTARMIGPATDAPSDGLGSGTGRRRRPRPGGCSPGRSRSSSRG